MYSLGRLVIRPEDYVKIMAERAKQAEEAQPGSPEDPFVLEPLVVEVPRAGSANIAGFLALSLLGGALFLRKRRV